MLTKRGSPLDINIKFFIGDIQHKMNIDSQQLDALTKDIDTILFIDLINRMIHRIPDQRETCENLIDHAALKSNEERLEIVQHLAAKCFDGDECKNEYLVKIMDKKKVHLKRSLAEDSAEWKELLAETSRLPRNPDIKICSSLLKIFAEQVIIISWLLTLNL